MTHVHASQGVFTKRDREFLWDRGISIEEARRQVQMLITDSPHWTHADRACTVGDGVLQIDRDDRARFISKGREAIEQGRLMDFIPASGAASRMFADLSEGRKRGGEFLQSVPTLAEEGEPLAKAVLSIFRSLSSFAFYQELREVVLKLSEGRLDLESVSAENLLSQGYGKIVIKAMIGSEGLGLKDRPKALIPFHCYDSNDIRTPLAEHLNTAADLCAGNAGVCKLHFTCSPEHRAEFERQAREVSEKLTAKSGGVFEVTFSVQEPHTDTVCVTTDGELFRDNGDPLLRPGGHGALLYNLNRLAAGGADVASITNIDNVHPEKTRREFLDTKLILLGVLCEVQEMAHLAVRSLKVGELEAESIEELHSELSRQLDVSVPPQLWHASTLSEKRDLLIAALDRPVRVVGVVRNTGEAGGGPFWVRGADGSITRQIVEKHELNPKDADQVRLFNEGTHFNPVRLMCGLRDHAGHPHVLSDFVNEDAVLIGSKSVNGTKVKILERPGLWNGSMAGWITVFVEVDGSTFAPVKSVIDLARPAHQC